MKLIDASKYLFGVTYKSCITMIIVHSTRKNKALFTIPKYFLNHVLPVCGKLFNVSIGNPLKPFSMKQGLYYQQQLCQPYYSYKFYVRRINKFLADCPKVSIFYWCCNGSSIHCRVMSGILQNVAKKSFV